MSDLIFEVKNMFPGTDKQVAVGIHATFNLTMSDSDGILVQANDMKLMKSKEGKWFIGSPSRTYQKMNKETNVEETKRMDYIKFFPEQKNWPKQDNIIKLVLAELQTKKESKPSSPAPTRSSPSSKPAPAPKASTNEPW